MVDDLFIGLVVRELGLVAGEEFAVMLDFWGRAELFPIGLNSAHAVRADGDDLLDLLRLHRFEVGLGELLEDEIVAEAAGRVASAFLFAQHAVAGAEVAHDLDEAADDLAAFGVVAAHAAEPEAVFLGAVEDGQLLFLNKLIAFKSAQAERVGVAFEGVEELAAVLVVPLAGVGGAAPEADDDGDVFDADRALELTSSAGGALKGGFLGVVLAEEELFGRGAVFVEIAANAEDDFFGVEDLAGVVGGAVLGAAATLDAGIGLQADELGQVLAGDEAEVFIAGERRNIAEAAS